MANELSFANLETDAGLAHYLSGLIVELVGERTDIRSTLAFVPWQANAGSATTKVTQYDGDHAFSAATSEIVGGSSNSDLGTANFQLTIARYLMQWQESDLWGKVRDPATGGLSIPLLAQIMVKGMGITTTALICDLFPSLSSNVGNVAATMNLDYFYDAMFQLNIARTPGPFACVLRPKQFNELQSSIRAESGVNQFKAAAADITQQRNPGFKGTFLDVGIWDTDSVDADGGAAYYQGAMYGSGCFAYTEAPAMAQTSVAAPQSFIDAGPLLIEFDRDAANGLTTIYGNYYPAVVEAEDAQGVEIRSIV